MPSRDHLRVDLHVKVLDKHTVNRARHRGLDAVVYAPHFVRLPEIRKQAERYSTTDFTVIPAREIFTGSWSNRKHVLAIGLREPVPDFITLSGAIDELVSQDAAILVPHTGFMTVSLGSRELHTYRDRIHAIETYNPKHLRWHNRAASAFARRLDFPTFASSYAHLQATVGEVWTTFQDINPTETDIVMALKNGVSRSISRQTGPMHRVRCLAEFAHLGYENSWQKLIRVTSSKLEATHPDHPEYDGRFDDVKVY